VRPVRSALAAVAASFLLVLLVAPSSGAAPGGAQRSYVVVLADSTGDVDAAARQHASDQGGRLGHVYRHALKGFSITMPEGRAAALARQPGVVSVEEDAAMHLSSTQANPPSWGIDRIDQRALPLSGSYTYNSTGSGVRAYIIDTGIRATHVDFGGRVLPGVNTVDASPSTQDCNGHGTHVAGTVGGASYGVAKGVTLVAVRVFGCGNSTTTSAIIAGVDWVTGNHQAGQPAAANMSLGGGASSALDTAVRRMIADGVSTAIAAGNGNALGFAIDSCSQSPGRVAEGITVGATDRTDRKASFSNYGTCVDLHAPGVDIVSASGASDTGAATLSGTSMATPHVVGVAAQYLQLNPTASPAAVQSAIKASSTKGIVTGAGGGLFGGSTPNNHLLFTNH
jgi:subtilisin family serine protease